MAGGDGTIGPAAETAGRIGVPLAVIATGTANDFARANELPGRPARGRRAGRHRHRDPRAWSSAGSPTAGRSSTSPAPGSPPRPRSHASPFKKVLGPLAYGVGALRAAATESPMRCTRPRRRRDPLRGRRLAADRRRRRRVRRRLGDRRGRPAATASSTSRSCPPARGSRSPAAPGACAAARSSSRSRSSTTAGCVVEVELAARRRAQRGRRDPRGRARARDGRARGLRARRRLRLRPARAARRRGRGA